MRSPSPTSCRVPRARWSPPLGAALRLALLAVLACGACTPTAPSSPTDTAQLFSLACARCHGPEGHGDGPYAGEAGPVPDLTTADLGRRYGRDALVALISDGRGKMPAHRMRLGAADIERLAAYVQRRFGGAP